MQVEKIPIKDLIPDPANLRKHDRKNLDVIKGSLKRFGQQKPIVIDLDNVVVAGNGTLQAATELGWESLDTVRTSLIGTDKIGFAIVDNRASDLSEFDVDALALMGDEIDLTELGFDEPPSDDPDEVKDEHLNTVFEVVVECVSESAQRVVYERLTNEGLKCRVLST